MTVVIDVVNLMTENAIHQDFFHQILVPFFLTTELPTRKRVRCFSEYPRIPLNELKLPAPLATDHEDEEEQLVHKENQSIQKADKDEMKATDMFFLKEVLGVGLLG